MAAERGATERRARRKAEASAAVPQKPWGLVRNPLPPLQLLDEEGMTRIENTAFRVLEELGLEFMSNEACRILEVNGCKVDHSTGLVKMDREIVLAAVAKAPQQFAKLKRTGMNLLV